MTMDANELARLREVAEAATPGPWTDVPMGSEGSIVTAGGNTHRTALKPATCREFSDATHIATFDPPTALALLDEVERLTNTEKAQGVTIRELEDENAELNNELGTAVQVLKLERDGLTAEVERLHSWAGLIELLDEHWPKDIFPTLPDDKGRDLGPRLVSLIRINDQLRGRLAAVGALARELIAAQGDGQFGHAAEARRIGPELVTLAEGGPAPGPDPEGGVDLTDEEFVAFLKAAKS